MVSHQVNNSLLIRLSQICKKVFLGTFFAIYHCYPTFDEIGEKGLALYPRSLICFRLNSLVMVLMDSLKIEGHHMVTIETMGNPFIEMSAALCDSEGSMQ